MTLPSATALAVCAEKGALEAGKDVTKDDREIVSAVHRALVGKVGQERFAVWFGRGVRMEPCGKTLRIAAADTFRRDYLRRTFRADLIEAARIVSHLLEITIEEVEFVVDPNVDIQRADAGSQKVEAGDCSSNACDLPAIIPSGQYSVRNNQDGARSSQSPSTGASLPSLLFPPSPTQSSKPSIPRRQFASLNDYIASEPNRVALTAAQTAATRPGVYTPLTFVGPAGCGKTHLLEGIWRQIRTNGTLRSVVYLTAEQFTNQFIDAIRDSRSGTPSFRRKVRDVDMLLIDDVQFFAGKNSTITEVVHTIDTLLRSGRQLVFAAARPLAELQSVVPEIVTRLAGGLVCTLEPADFGARLGILQQISKRQEMTVADDVLNWLASQLDGDARHLAGALNRLRAASEAHEELIDLSFAQDSLADLIHASRRPVRVPDIVEAVCDVMGVARDDLQSSSKSTNVTLPRMLVMFLARKWTRAALSEISRTVGRKSHSTVVSAQQKVTQWLSNGKTVSLGHGECRVEDAIKRIECHLRLA
jgi:chromosomal replication initiator protein